MQSLIDWIKSLFGGPAPTVPAPPAPAAYKAPEPVTPPPVAEPEPEIDFVPLPELAPLAATPVLGIVPDPVAEEEPTDIPSLMEKARALIAATEYAAASALLAKVLAIDPDNEPAKIWAERARARAHKAKLKAADESKP